MWPRIKKLWILSSLDSAHLENLLERAKDDAEVSREIPIRGDGDKKKYIVRKAVFIPRIQRDPVQELTQENA